MRGKVTSSTSRSGVTWITPAYAGKRPLKCRNVLQKWDHPRLCGEKRPFEAVVYRYVGSPPPMRGKAEEIRVLNIEGRITPAYAGKSAFDASCFDKFWDHPRLCGEKPAIHFWIGVTTGSPPPMRGKAHGFADRCQCKGITPAYAGKRW